MRYIDSRSVSCTIFFPYVHPIREINGTQLFKIHAPSSNCFGVGVVEARLRDE